MLVLMPVSPARTLARDVLLAVEQCHAYAADLLHAPPARALSPEDARLATELVMGVLRWRGQLDYLLERAARRRLAAMAPLVRAALRLGAYQLRFLSRVPPQAAVHQSVEMAKAEGAHLGGFVNAVLRHLPRAPLAVLLAADTDLARRREAEFSHPAWLLERWSRAYSPAAADAVAEYDNQPPPVAIRLAHGAAWPVDVELASGRLLQDARRVVAGDVTRTPAFRARALWVQDEASQLIPLLLEPAPGERILDACAAPGGKTAILLETAPGGLLIALERHQHRARLLRRRVPAAAVVVGDVGRLPLAGGFDRILLDAPCTGTGTLARNPEIRWRLRPGDPARLARLQLAWLLAAAAALRPNGRLVYSVCSIEPEEGEAVVAAALAAGAGLERVPAAAVLGRLAARGVLAAPPAALTAGDALRLLPGAYGTDGFFAAVLRRAR